MMKTVHPPRAVPVHYPAMVHCAETHDFVHIAQESELGEHHWYAGDRLIDVAGQVHLLSQSEGGGLYWRALPGLVCLPELNASLRHFAAGLSICCIPKLTVRSAEEAVALVAWLEMQ
ncbi:DUF4144 family protein [Oceanimonas sp. CHS3-5]|uniref:DUF4144 family protein n=1 Tax=Oceanimonas sp. CHS3-5 TaxID=3068186 RepID=UPI002740047D|nr:DUF4144 family protein [Oceanimonas sp. CHS3-5]MDP5291352.1 DUF4144 family protein [Oceanimonas sp. CHS3-5]